MIELATTNNPVRLSFLRAVLDEAAVKYVVLDGQMASVLASAVDARLMVDRSDLAQARRLIAAAEASLDPG
jgi:hypothetical protein